MQNEIRLVRWHIGKLCLDLPYEIVGHHGRNKKKHFRRIRLWIISPRQYYLFVNANIPPIWSLDIDKLNEITRLINEQEARQALRFSEMQLLKEKDPLEIVENNFKNFFAKDFLPQKTI